MATWAGVVLLVASLRVVAGDCPAGKYGNMCSYQCHCPPGYCNPTSGCHPANCSQGWSGPTCQRENIALNKTTSSSSVYMPSSNAVNGDTRGDDENRCFHSVFTDASITSAWWRVDLGKDTLVRDVIIYFRTDNKVRRNGIKVYIADTATSPTDGVNCYNVTGNRDGTNIPDVLKVTCSGEGRYLVLYTTTVNNIDDISVPVLDFCEVKVEVCGPGTFGADCDKHCHCLDEACNYISGVCPSGVCLPGWKTDECDAVCDAGSYGTNCRERCSDRHCKGDNSSCDHVTTMCVSGCSAGWEGTNCVLNCVNHATGKCTNGCRPGWNHIDCTQACVQGVEYGPGCVGNCSVRMCDGGSGTCPQDTGRCEKGCQSGWKEEDCTIECIQGVEYGAGCVGNCSTRKCQGGPGTCPRDTGRCESGCQSGWTRGDCTQELVNENSTTTTEPSFSDITGVVIVVVVGVVLTLLLGGAVLLYLLRKRRLLWSRRPVNDGGNKKTPDTGRQLHIDIRTATH